MVTTKVMEQVQLIDGQFKPLDASTLIKKLIGEGINADKIERLKLLIGNENTDTSQIDAHINYLNREEKYIKEIIAEAQKTGRKIGINAKIEIALED